MQASTHITAIIFSPELLQQKHHCHHHQSCFSARTNMPVNHNKQHKSGVCPCGRYLSRSRWIIQTGWGRRKAFITNYSAMAGQKVSGLKLCHDDQYIHIHQKAPRLASLSTSALLNIHVQYCSFLLTHLSPKGFTPKKFGLRWREKFEKHNKLFSFSPCLWWVQAVAVHWLARFQTLQRARPIREEFTFSGCPGQRHLCTSEGRSSENWRNIKKDQRCSAIDASASEAVRAWGFFTALLDFWQCHTVMRYVTVIVDRRGSDFSCRPCCAICCSLVHRYTWDPWQKCIWKER